MHDLVLALLELQELEIILQESRIVHGQKRPEKVDNVESRVEKLRGEIPVSFLKRYDGLRRSGLGAVREFEGLCNGCHLKVPMGDLNRMRRGKMPWICPNCGRFFLLSEEKR